MQTSESVKLVTEEFMIPAVDPGIQLYVRNKRPEDMTQFAPDTIVLFVHGSTQDTRDFFGAGKLQYDPAGIRVPTLVIVAERDSDTPPAMAQGYFARLTSAPYKRLVMIGEGTHSVMMEKNRMRLFREVQLFLDEPAPHK